MKFRDLNKDDIEVRVQSATERGVILLLYKNARVDMNILDEAVGAENWQREHYECKGNLFCRVGIRHEGEWVYKSDCGTESNTEAQKGEASDSFKRACFNWGIGRELYTAPFIWVSAENCNIRTKQGQRGVSYHCYDDFSVQSITVKDKQITSLTVYNNQKRCAAYTYGSKKNEAEQLPFPEAEQKRAPAPSAPIPNPANFGRMTREQAGAVKYEGMALTDLYKHHREVFMQILNYPPTPEIGEATKIVLDWVNSARAGA